MSLYSHMCSLKPPDDGRGKEPITRREWGALAGDGTGGSGQLHQEQLQRLHQHLE